MTRTCLSKWSGERVPRSRRETTNERTNKQKMRYQEQKKRKENKRRSEKGEKQKKRRRRSDKEKTRIHTKALNGEPNAQTESLIHGSSD